MLFLGINLENILVIFSIEIIIVIIFILLGFNLLIPKEDNLNIYFVRFFRLFALGNFFLIVYLIFMIITLNKIIELLVYCISIFFLCIALYHLNIVNNLILKSNITFQNSQINRSLKIYYIFLLSGIIIIGVIFNNLLLNFDVIIINSDFLILLYSFIFLVIFSIIPLSKKNKTIIENIKNSDLKFYFRSFYRGIFGLYTILFLEYFSIFLSFSIFKILLYFVMLSFLYWIYEIYKALIKRIKKKK